MVVVLTPAVIPAMDVIGGRIVDGLVILSVDGVASM